MNRINVLVTGAAGDIAQSICKILRQNTAFHKIIGTDLSVDHLGKFIFDQIEVIPACKEANYKEIILNVIERYQIDLLIPASEPELKFIHHHPFTDEMSFKVIMANHRAQAIGFDKYLTSQFLKENNLPFPATQLASETSQLSYPFIAKSRQGSGSKSVHLVKEDIDWNYIRNKHDDLIVQEFIPGDDTEYTCGLFRSTKGITRSIIIKRKMMPGSGLTGVGEVVLDQDIDELLARIATNFDLKGSINVQLRKPQNIPLVFEINPRFSSTVLFRHLLGFEDLIWSVEDAVGSEISEYQPVVSGKRFYRGFSEYIEE